MCSAGGNVFAELCLKVRGDLAVMKEHIKAKQPGHQAQGYFLAGVPVDSLASRVTFQKASNLREESVRKIGRGFREKSSATGHDISLRKTGCFPTELDISHPRFVSEHTRPIDVGSPPIAVEGIAVPVYGIAEISHPLAEAKNTAASRFGGLESEVREVFTSHKRANRVRDC